LFSKKLKNVNFEILIGFYFLYTIKTIIPIWFVISQMYAWACAQSIN